MAFVDGHEDALVTKAGWDRVAASEVGGCPVRAMDSGAEGALGGGLRVELRPCRWASRCPNDVARLRGGFFVMSLQVRRGREDRKPFRTAFMRVDVEGEQRERTTYNT